MSIILSRASEQNLKIDIRDKRTLYLDGRPCQVIKARWFKNFPNCKAMSMYMPRTGFADFLLYIIDQGTVYVMPRGNVSHDTTWSELSLEPFKEAWHLLKETAPGLFERRTQGLSDQLQTVIAAAEQRNMSYELVRSKRGARTNDYRTYKQRRIVIEGRRCAIFTASLLPEESHPWPTAIFKISRDPWPKFFLYILHDDIYVVPRNQMPHETTLDLESRIFDYKNNWSVLKGADSSSGESNENSGH